MKLKAGETAWSPGDESGVICILKEGQEPPKTKREVLCCQLEVLKRLVDEADAEDPSMIDGAETFLLEELPEGLKMVLDRGFLRKEKGRALLIMDCPEDIDTPIEQWRSQADPKNAGRPVSKREAQEMAEELDLMLLVGCFVEGTKGTGMTIHEN